MGTRASGAPENGDLGRSIQHRGCALQQGCFRADCRLHRIKRQIDASQRRLLESRVAGEYDHRYTPLRERSPDCYLEYPRHLARMGDYFTVVAAIPEDVVGLSLLKILAADLATGNLRGDRQHRHTIALAIVEAIDEVSVPRPATAGTDREIARQMSLSPSRKGGCFFVAGMYPSDRLVYSNRIRDRV